MGLEELNVVEAPVMRSSGEETCVLTGLAAERKPQRVREERSSPKNSGLCARCYLSSSLFVIEAFIAKVRFVRLFAKIVEL